MSGMTAPSMRRSSSRISFKKQSTPRLLQKAPDRKIRLQSKWRAIFYRVHGSSRKQRLHWRLDQHWASGSCNVVKTATDLVQNVRGATLQLARLKASRLRVKTGASRHYIYHAIHYKFRRKWGGYNYNYINSMNIKVPSLVESCASDEGAASADDVACASVLVFRKTSQ